LDFCPVELPVASQSNSAIERLFAQILPDNQGRLKHVEIKCGEFSYSADYYETPAVVYKQ